MSQFEEIEIELRFTLFLEIIQTTIMTSTEFKNTITERMKAVRHLSPTEKQKTRRYLLRMTRCEICESIVEENYRYRNQKGEICEDVICFECETERGVPRWVWDYERGFVIDSKSPFLKEETKQLLCLCDFCK